MTYRGTQKEARRVLILTLWLASATAWALDPGKPPGGNFDLSRWYLQLPTSNGILTGAAGTVDSASTVQLMAGFTNAYFRTGPDGTMVFWAPVTGARTIGSQYPRSELRELIQPPSTQSNWFAHGVHILDAECKVLEVPSTRKVIIGQIHGHSGAALPTVKLQYNDGALEGFIKTNATDTTLERKFLFGTVGLSNSITYQIKVVNGLVSIAMNGVTNSVNIFVADPQWANETMYYKAGNYCQDNAGTSNEGARVAFYAVTLFHAPSITNQPAGQTVTVGSNVTFTVGAAGNPPLKYAWRRNNTAINNATNASLTIPNVQLTNAGDYSVIVTDGVGVVTSSVATLTVLAPPASPTGLTATPLSETQVRLAWTDNATNETAYGVERSPDSNTWSALTSSLPANSTNDTDATCNASTLYYYRVHCTNAGGASAYAVVSLTTPAGVGDGIPGWWRLQHFGDGLTTNGSSCATCDPDGDGLANLQEFLAATDPTDNAAVLRIVSISREDDDIRIAWTMGEGKTNALERSVGDAGGSYSNDYTAIFTVTNTVGSVTNYLDISAATNQPAYYYRIRLVP